MLNLFDFIISSVMLTFFFSGLFTGAIRLMLNNISFIASLFLSSLLFPSAQTAVDEYISSSIIANIFAGSISYIISLVICSMLFRKIKVLIKPICGGFIDKTCGALLGALNGILICIVLFIAAVSISGTQNILNHDNLYQMIKSFDSNSYPRWLKNSKSFDIVDGGLKIALKIPYLDVALQKINFDNILDSDTLKNTDKQDTQELDKQINNFLK